MIVDQVLQLLMILKVVGALLLTLCVWVLELPGTNHAIAITTSDLSQVFI